MQTGFMLLISATFIMQIPRFLLETREKGLFQKLKAPPKEDKHILS